MTRAPRHRVMRQPLVVVALALSMAAVWWLLTHSRALGEPPADGPVPPAGLFLSVGVGEYHSCAVRANGDAACWGSNEQGAAPARVAGPFTSISAGTIQTCAIRGDRSIACWGDNSGGAAPPRVAGEFSAVSSAGFHTCALHVNRDISCWGAHETLTRVAGPFLAVSAGYANTCAVRANGDAVCFGSDEVAGPFTSVAAGWTSNCALKTDRDIVCWGDNDYGQAPPTIAGPFDFLTASRFDTCAIRSGGTLSCWGENSSGQAPTEVVGPFVSVSTQNQSTCAIREDQTLTCWGLFQPLPPPSPAPAPPGTATVGVEYTHSFETYLATGSVFSLSGALPSGVTLANGVLHGTPRATGGFDFKVTATNLFGSTTAAFHLDVKPTKGFDANADGLPDLVIGADGEDVGRAVDAGAVTVLYGASDGSFGRPGSLTITQESVGQVSEKGDRFGAAVAIADVTGDAHLDLVIGAPGENAGAGQVVVVQGSAARWTGATRTVLRQGLSGAAGAAEAGDGFGSTISVGNGLWVGAPGENLGRATDAGVVSRFLTKPLRATGSIQYQQGSRKVPGAPESGDRFGAALAGGGTVIGAPGEDVGNIVDAGIVTVGLTHAISQDSRGIPGSSERGDQFGAAVAISRLWSWDSEGDGQSWLDLIAVGAPAEDVGSVRDAGSVTVIDTEWASSHDWGAEPTSVVQNSLSPGQAVEAGDRFGASLLISTKTTASPRDVDDDRIELETEARLVVGAPGEDVGTRTTAGAVTVLPTEAGCSDDCGYWVDEGTTLSQGSKGVTGSPGTNNAFGTNLAQLPGVDWGLAIGAPGQNINNHPSAGSVTVINPPALPSRLVHQDSAGVSGAAETGDRFSTVSTQ